MKRSVAIVLGLAFCVGCLPHLVQASDKAKAGPKSLPPKVVKAWTNAGAQVTWVGVGAKAREDMTKLQMLCSGGKQGADAGVKEQAGMENLPRLGRGQVTDAGLKNLAALKSLQWLDLGHRDVTDAGLKELAGLKS